MKSNFEDPISYLQEFYSQIDSENDALIRWLQHTPPSNTCIEVGCGPSLMAALAYGHAVDLITLTDKEHFNLSTLAHCMNGSRLFSWHLFEERCKLTIEELLPKVELFKYDINCDVIPSHLYDGAVSCFGLEVASSNLLELQVVCEKFLGLVRPGGWFRTAIIAEAEYYLIKGEKFFCHPVRQYDLIEIFTPWAGDLSIQHVPPSSDHGYKGFYLVGGTICPQ